MSRSPTFSFIRARRPDNDPGWVDLTPDLSKNPVQVDLLGVANQCFLAQLGSNGLKPGSYQQIRILLAANGASVANDKCGGSANCVMLTSGRREADPCPSCTGPSKLLGGRTRVRASFSCPIRLQPIRNANQPNELECGTRRGVWNARHCQLADLNWMPVNES